MDDFAKVGWALKARALPEPTLLLLLDACVAQGAVPSVHRPSGRTYGLRGLNLPLDRLATAFRSKSGTSDELNPSLSPSAAQQAVDADGRTSS